MVAEKNPLYAEIDRLRQQNKELAEALETLIKKYWCNKGQNGKPCPHPTEFIDCITSNGIPDYWRKADKVLAKYDGGK
ncbi:MAG: hypothetical protein V1932_07715 [Chloroflexota bacterium]